MALKGNIEEKVVDGKTVKVFTLEFTNGTVQQLKEISDFLESEDFKLPTEEKDRYAEAVEVGIAWLERLRKQSLKAEVSSE